MVHTLSSFFSREKKKFFLFLLSVVCISFAGFFVVQAQSAGGVSINKTSVEFYGYPGQVITATVELRNNTVSKNSYSSKRYDMYRSPDYGGNNNPETINWIQAPQSSIYLYSGDKRNFTYTISIPKETKSGDYKATISFKEQVSTGRGESVSFKVVIHVNDNVGSFDVGMPISTLTQFEKQKYLDDLYVYVEKTGSNIAYTKLKLLENKFKMKGSSRTVNSNSYYYGYNTLSPNSYSLLDAAYGPLGQTLTGDTDLKGEIDFMTGARAVDETLQLGSVNSRRPLLGEQTIPISQVQPLNIKSHPWDEMIAKHPKTETSAIFTLVPEDHFVAYFDEMKHLSDLEAALKEMLSLGDYFFDMKEMLNVRQTIIKRLGIENIEKFEAMVGEFAFVSEDLSFVPGTNYALILKLDPGSQKITDMLITGKSIRGEVGDYYVIASSQKLFDSISNTRSGKVNSMSKAKDFIYAAAVLDKNRDGMVYLSEKFILKIVNPEYRINANRRNDALLKLESMQYTVFAYRSIIGAWPKSVQQMKDEGYLNEGTVQEFVGYSIDGEGRVSQTDWGTLYDVTPLGNVPVVNVSKSEKDRYESFKSGYERYWREFFDPVGVAVKVSDQIYFHTIILPLIDESTYNYAKDLIGKNGAVFDGITNPPRDIPMLLLTHMNFDDFLVTTLGSLNEARSRGKTAAVQATLNNLRAQAELSYDTSGNSYASVCSDKTTVQMFESSEEYAGTKAVCFNSKSKYAASIEMVKGSGAYYCVDSTGKVGWTSSGVTTTACPQGSLDSTEARKRIDEASATNDPTLEEKKKLINEELNKEFKEFFDKPFDFFGIIGNELQVGAGTSTAYKLENIADTDLFVGIKLQDRKRAEEFINAIYKGFAKEYSDNRGGFFSFSSDQPIKNEYNGVAYYMIPTGFVNLYYLFSDDGYIYFTISQKAVNNLAQGTSGSSKNKKGLSDIQKRSLDYIGKEHGMLFIADLTTYDNYKKGLLDKALEPSYFTLAQAVKLHSYVSDAQFLQKSISANPAPTTLADAEKYIVNIPKTFLGIPIEVTVNDILFGKDKHPYASIDFGKERYSYYGSNVSDTKFDITFDKLFSDEDKQKILKSWNAFTGFSIGLTFTEEGLSTKVAINNPLIKSKGSTGGWNFIPYLIGFGVLVVVIAGVSMIIGVRRLRLKRKMEAGSIDPIDSSKKSAITQVETVQEVEEIKKIEPVRTVSPTIPAVPIEPSKELIDYIKASLEQGTLPKDVRTTLLQNGWSESDIQRAFDHLGK
jgi:hypothetical protein